MISLRQCSNSFPVPHTRTPLHTGPTVLYILHMKHVHRYTSHTMYKIETRASPCQLRGSISPHMHAVRALGRCRHRAYGTESSPHAPCLLRTTMKH